MVAIYSTFFQRAFDQLLHDVCMQRLPVTIALDRAGLVGEDGPTHHGVFDLSYLRLMPNLTVMAPATLAELEAMLAVAVTLDGPCALRYPKGHTALKAAGDLRDITDGRAAVLREGTAVTAPRDRRHGRARASGGRSPCDSRHLRRRGQRALCQAA